MNHTLETKEAHLLYSCLSRLVKRVYQKLFLFPSYFFFFFFQSRKKIYSNSFNNFNIFCFVCYTIVSECRLNPNSNLSYRLFLACKLHRFYCRHVVFAQNYYTYTQSDTYKHTQILCNAWIILWQIGNQPHPATSSSSFLSLSLPQRLCNVR